MLITDEYRALNAQVHEGKGWGKGGTEFLFPVQYFAQAIKAHTILDYGCGKGALVRELNKSGYATHGYDPAVETYQTMPIPADLVVCTDVLEHVEPECITDVLQHINGLADVGIYLIIALHEAVKVLPDGRNAHILVRPVDWWINELELAFGKAKNFEMSVGVNNMSWEWERQ